MVIADPLAALGGTDPKALLGISNFGIQPPAFGRG